MDPMLEIVHKVEKDMGRRLTQEEYKSLAEYVEVEARKLSISRGLGELYAWVRTLPEDVKENIKNIDKEW